VRHEWKYRRLFAPGRLDQEFDEALIHPVKVLERDVWWEW
jgi:hypothetical protein